MKNLVAQTKKNLGPVGLMILGLTAFYFIAKTFSNR